MKMVHKLVVRTPTAGSKTYKFELVEGFDDDMFAWALDDVMEQGMQWLRQVQAVQGLEGSAGDNSGPLELVGSVASHTL